MFADNEDWLAILGEAIYQYQKKTVRKMILKIIKTHPDGPCNHRDPSASGEELDIIPRIHGFCYVHPWTDSDLQNLPHTPSFSRHSAWMDWNEK